MTDWIGSPYAKAIDDGVTAAGFYAHAQPFRKQVQAILDGLDRAGLLVTGDRLDEIATAVEDLRLSADPSEWPALERAANTVRRATR